MNAGRGVEMSASATPERKIASSHVLLIVPCMIVAIGCIVAPVFGIWHEWRWWEPAQKVAFIGYDLVFLAISVLLFRAAVIAGIFVSEGGLRVQRVFRSEAIPWHEIGKVVPQGIWQDGRWLLLQRGSWGEFTPDGRGASPPTKVFIPSGGILISTSYSAAGLRRLAEELLRHVPPVAWSEDPRSRQWLEDQAEGRGSLISRLI